MVSYTNRPERWTFHLNRTRHVLASWYAPPIDSDAPAMIPIAPRFPFPIQLGESSSGDRFPRL